jgi:NADPH2:quinone reductase
MAYTRGGESDVMSLIERPDPDPGPGEVRVRVLRSGVNPTDWKARQNGAAQLPFDLQVPNQDGAGVIDAIGPDVSSARIGQRVWIWEAAYGRAEGTAQDYVVLPSRHAVGMPDHVPFDVGASLGIPFLTAHRCLTVLDNGPGRLAPSSLSGRTVLVAGGAGAVGNAAIQLARWAEARVIATVSSRQKAELALAAGADDVVNYRDGDAAQTIKSLAPGGVDIIVEVAPGQNAALDAAVIGRDGVVAVYAGDRDTAITLSGRGLMTLNARWQFVLVYTVPRVAKDAAIAAVSEALAAGEIQIGDRHGLPVRHFDLADAAKAHDAVEGGAIGKVLIDLD